MVYFSFQNPSTDSSIENGLFVGSKPIYRFYTLPSLSHVPNPNLNPLCKVINYYKCLVKCVRVDVQDTLGNTSRLQVFSDILPHIIQFGRFLCWGYIATVTSPEQMWDEQAMCSSGLGEFRNI